MYVPMPSWGYSAKTGRYYNNTIQERLEDMLDCDLNKIDRRLDSIAESHPALYDRHADEFDYIYEQIENIRAFRNCEAKADRDFYMDAYGEEVA